MCTGHGVLDGLYTGPNAITFGFNTFHDIHQIRGQITDIENPCTVVKEFIQVTSKEIQSRYLINIKG